MNYLFMNRTFLLYFLLVFEDFFYFCMLIVYLELIYLDFILMLFKGEI